MMPKSEPSGAEGALLTRLAKARVNVPTQTIPLWNARKHDVRAASSFARELKQYNCSHCTNGSCTACKLRRNMTPEGKGGEGSGYFGPRPPEKDKDWGGSAPRSGTPDLAKAASGRVQFHKNRIAKEIVAHAARIRQIDEKPFRGVKDRLEARRHLKEMRKKAKTLDLPEDQVWDVIDRFPVQEQAFLATTAKLEQSNSAAKKVAKGVAAFLLRKKIQDLGAKYAPSPLIEEEEVRKLSIAETASYLAAYATDPAKAVEFLTALKDGNITKAHAIRSRGFQDARSNTQAHVRNKDWLEMAAGMRKVLERQARRNPGAREPTQREFEKLVSDALRNRSRQRLEQHRTERGQPRIRFAGFGGTP